MQPPVIALINKDGEGPGWVRSGMSKFFLCYICYILHRMISGTAYSVSAQGFAAAAVTPFKIDILS